MSEPNFLLDALLDEARISYAGLASRLNKGRQTRYDHTAVARWIRDHAIPRGDAPSLICEIIGPKVGRVLTIADIGMDRTNDHHGELPLRNVLDHATALWRGDTKHSEYVRKTALLRGAAAIAPVFEWENPPDDFDVSNRGTVRVGASDVQRIRDARHRYEQMYRRVGGVPVRPRVVAFLNSYATPLIRGGYDDETGRELFRAVGGLVALAGISAYDSDLQPLAQRYLFHALRMAKASGNRSFGGYVVALLANQSMYRGNFRQVLQYSETALRGSRNELSPALVVDLHTLRAKAYARIGDRRGCHENMRGAESAVGRIRRENEPPETGYVQPGLVETQHAEALRRLGDLKGAQEYAEESVRTSDDCHARGQAHRLATLALVLGQRGAVEEAVTVGDQMLDRAQGMESGRILDRVQTVVDALGSYDTEVVRDFRGRAEQQISVPL